MHNSDKLVPQAIFYYFEQICRVPRPSKSEEKIRDFLILFSQSHQLIAKLDEIGNLLIIKPASKGMENLKKIILQSHIDMVCEKNEDVKHNFDTDPIDIYIDGDWIKAKGTTLGADCGIGMAAALAVLADQQLEHGPVECLFTVDEETGLTGAKYLKSDFLTGNILLNLDSSDEGELFVGCAGGVDTKVCFTYSQEKVPTNYIAFRLSVSGLLGGHSGDDINKGRANSLKLITRFLLEVQRKHDARIALIEGGNLRNAIPREAYVVFLVHKCLESAIYDNFKSTQVNFYNEYKITEPNIQLSLEKDSLPMSVMDELTQYELLQALNACPNGVLGMSFELSNLVETSSNLASIKFLADNQILIETSQRSSVESQKWNAASMVRSVFELAGAAVEHGSGYPGWQPNSNSQILDIVQQSYRRLFDTLPAVKAVHAGLECGLFLKSYPSMDMISFGPTILGAHSPEERLNIPSVAKFWELLVDVLKNIPNIDNI